MADCSYVEKNEEELNAHKYILLHELMYVSCSSFLRENIQLDGRNR